MFKSVSRRTVLATLVALGTSCTAFAANPPSTGLGQAWPNATDVSASPNWHVYVFVMGGIEYVQVNDLNGNVLGAVGAAGGQYITLPIGKFAQYVSTPQQPAAATSNAMPSGQSTTVYKDSATNITATPQSDGSTKLNAMPAPCTDPDLCNGHSA